MNERTGTPKASYNTVFERLVRSDDDLEGFIAYGAYKLAKREWRRELELRTGAAPVAADLDAYHRTWTDTALKGLKDNSSTVLSNYGKSIILAEKPQIERDALIRGRPVWKDVLIAVASAFAYSVLLLVTGLIISHFGVDLSAALRGR